MAVLVLVVGLARGALAEGAYGGATERREVVDAGHVPVLTKAPALLSRVEPIFPEEARAQQLAGDVTMQVDIGADGRVAHVEVLTPAGHGFDEAAVAAVQQFTFSPAEMDDVPAPVRITYTEHFIWSAPIDAGTPESPDGGGVDAGPNWPIRLQGRVLERATRKPIAGAQVAVAGVEAETVTDPKGNFALALPPGNLGVTVKSVGHDPFFTVEKLAEHERNEVTYYLMPKAYGLYESVVHGERDKKEVTRHTLDREELEKVPGSLGDPIRVIQDLPGVARAPFVTGALIVRGSAPTDTGSYLDGVEIPLLFHFLGGPSVVNPEFLDRIDFYPGGFGPEYGRAIGGIVDVQTRAPKADEWHGSGKIDLIDTGVYLAAPIADGLSVSAAARRSYLDAVLGVVLPLLGDNTVSVSPRYYDYQLRVDWAPPRSPKNRYRIFAFGSDDLLTVVSAGNSNPATNFTLNNHISFQRLSAGWTFHDGAITHNLAPYLGLDGVSFGVGKFQFDDTDLVAGLRQKLALELGKAFTLRTGLDLELIRSTYTARFPSVPFDYRPFPGESPEKPDQKLGGIINEYDWAAWVEGELKLPGRIRIIPGLRFDYFYLHDQVRTAVDPRLILRKEFGDLERPWTVKGAVGLYHESPGAPNLDPLFGNPAEPLQAAFQSSLGVEHKLTANINFDVTGFFNRRYDIAANTNDLVRQSDGSLKRVLVGPVQQGRAYGVEVLLRHEITEHFFGWVAYTFSESLERLHREQYHPAIFDETHILTLIGQYKFGNGWELGSRFRLVTGIPDTPIRTATFDADTESYRPTNGPIGSTRQPTFKQLDLRVDRTFLFDRWQLGLYLDVQNVLNTTNQEGVLNDYRFRGTEVIPGIPFLPTLGVKGSF
jgi:TonB family protein